MNAPDLHNLSIAEAAGLIATRRLSPLEYVDALIARTERLDPVLHAYLERTQETAREQALLAEREISAGRYRGPLHGIPYALKDVIDVTGLATTGNSRLRIDAVSHADATVARRLDSAGALMMGKLGLHEFAHGGPSFDLPWPPVRNPWNLAHVPGGSSSGCASAVAAGLVPAAVGTDTGGSIRIPASMCGITGLMPTFGLVGRTGVMPHSFTFDRCGPMAATAEDCALLLQTLAGHDAQDPGSVRSGLIDYRAALTGALRGMRIGVLRHAWEEDVPVSPDLRAALEEALRTLRALGATLEDCRVRPLRDYNDVKVILAESEIVNVHLQDLRRRPGDFGADIRTRMLPALLFSAQDYVMATREHRCLVAQTLALHERYDVLLMAGQGEAPTFASHNSENFWTRVNPFTLPNVTGQPALAVPIGFGKDGLPLGMQLLGRPFDDATVLKVGHAYQQSCPWHRQRPPMVAETSAPALPEPALLPGSGDGADLHARELCLRAAAAAGVELDDVLLRQMLQGAPRALEMKARQQGRHGYPDWPSVSFRPHIFLKGHPHANE